MADGGRGGLDDAPFTYRTGGDRVFISWRGREVTVLKGKAAAQFLSRAEGAGVEAQQQLMARATGNFKRGNER